MPRHPSARVPCFAAIIALAASAATWCGQSSLQAAEPPQRPNILWLIAEDLGPELGCYGYEPARTPNLDRMAREGVLFERAFTVTPVCSTSRSSFMTGMYACSIDAHNHRSHRGPGSPNPLPEGVRLLTHWLADGGYFTANVRQLPKSVGFRGRGKTDWNFTFDGKAFDSSNWDDLKQNQPFYAQVNFSETHRRWHGPEQTDPNNVTPPPYYPDHPVVRQDWARYLDDVAELDRKIGKILEQLQADGLAENTVVMFVGDHGRAHVRGKQWCYDSGLHVPMIIRWPKSIPAPPQIKPGAREDRLVESIDWAPTMLAIAGLEKPEKMQGRVFLGEDADPPAKYVFGMRDRCDETVLNIRTVRGERYRYIRNGLPDRPFLQINRYKEMTYPMILVMRQLSAEGKLSGPPARLMAPERPPEELYDVEADPWEINNLADSAEHQEVLKEMRQALDEWRHKVDDPGLDAASSKVPGGPNHSSRRRDDHLHKMYEQAEPIDPVGLPDYLIEGIQTR